MSALSVAVEHTRQPRPHLLVLVRSDPHELSFGEDVGAEGAAAPLLEVDGLIRLVFIGLHYVYPWLVLVH